VDFGWTDEQAQFRENVLRLGREQLASGARENDLCGGFNNEGWRKCAEFGIQGLPIPEGFGGQGADILTTVAGLEALGLACPDNGLLFSIGAHLWACELPILTFGSQRQKELYLPKLSGGEWIGAFAMAEPESGSDAYSLRTTAVRQGEDYVLDGSKTMITNAPVADLMLVMASTDREKGWQGLTAFLVEPSAPGVTVRSLDKMGLRSSPLGEVFFDQFRIPSEARLGAEGAGAAVFAHAMEWERAFILAFAVGAMERVLDRTIEYARQRKQFGKPIGKFQLVSSKIVDMRLRLETCRALLYRTAWLKSQKKSVFLESAMTKLHISESWVQSCLDALQVFGGYGYLSDLEIERELRDALGSRIFSGTSEIQRGLISQLLGL